MEKKAIIIDYNRLTLHCQKKKKRRRRRRKTKKKDIKLTSAVTSDFLAILSTYSTNIIPVMKKKKKKIASGVYSLHYVPVICC